MTTGESSNHHIRAIQDTVAREPMITGLPPFEPDAIRLDFSPANLSRLSEMVDPWDAQRNLADATRAVAEFTEPETGASVELSSEAELAKARDQIEYAIKANTTPSDVVDLVRKATGTDL